MIQEIKDFITSVKSNAHVADLQTHKQLVTLLDQCQSQYSKIFANSIDKLVNIISANLSELNNIQKFEYFGIITNSVEVCPAIFRKNTQRIKNIYTLMCQIMCSIKNEVSEFWYHPLEIFQQDDLEKMQQYDSDSALVQKFRNIMDRLSSAVGYQKMLNTIWVQAESLYKVGDWRQKNAVLMTLSQLSEDLQLDQINNMMNLIKMGYKDPHPKVRFSAVQALGQFSDDLKPDFQKKYLPELMPIIIEGFSDDIQRVASHWMACLANLIDDYPNQSEIAQYTVPIINKISDFIQKGNKYSKQKAASALSCLLSVPSLFEKKTISKPFQICHSITQAYCSTKNNQLLNQAFQCITVAIEYQPYNLVEQYFSFATQIILQMNTEISSDYLVGGWSRLCRPEKKFNNWKICFTKIFQIIKAMGSQATALNSIYFTAKCFKEQFYPFTTDALTHLKDILSKSTLNNEQQTVNLAVDGIVQIMKLSKPTHPDQNWDKMVKIFVIGNLQKISFLIYKKEYSIVKRFLQATQQLISSYAVIFHDQMQQIYKTSMQIDLMLHQQKVKFLNNSCDHGNESDQDSEGQNKKQDVQKINSCKLFIPEVVREVAKKSQSPQALVNQIFIHASKSITNRLDDQDIIYAVYYFDNLLEDFDYQVLKSYWSKIQKHLTILCSKSQAQLRHPAVFGIGILTQKTPFELVTLETILSWIQILNKSINMPQRKMESKKTYGYCQDNCKSAYGKVLKRYCQKFDLRFMFDKWLGFLPLKFDQGQNQIQMQYLCEIIEKQPAILFDGSLGVLDRLKRVFKVIAELSTKWRKKRLNESKAKMLFKCKKALLIMKKWSLFVQNEQQVIKSLSTSEQFEINDLIQNPELLADFNL